MSGALVTSWFSMAPTLVTAWFGPDGRIEAIQRQVLEPEAIPMVIGPRGAKGDPGSVPERIEASLAATWILPNPLGRVPLVQVYLASGEQVIADVEAGATLVTVTFPTPQQGFVLIF